MQLTTPVIPDTADFKIEHNSKIMLLGSCFAQNIGTRLAAYKFDVCSNPFGITYNPSSIATILNRILDGKEFDEESPEIVEHNGKWHSMLHHGCFSQDSKESLLATTNSALSTANEQLSKCGIVTITLGTAYVYTRNSDNLVVNNCHKLPGKAFSRRLLSINEITGCLGSAMQRIIEQRPNIKFIFTVSPIRHLRDGAHDNQKSKATLLLAIEELTKMFPANCSYFPAYEIMLDELRDYRFYAEDMAHPSPLAVEYIWERFTACHIAGESIALCKEIAPIMRALAHRPFDERSSGYKEFIGNTLQKIETIKGKHPYIDFEKEIEKCNIQLSK